MELHVVLHLGTFFGACEHAGNHICKGEMFGFGEALLHTPSLKLCLVHIGTKAQGNTEKILEINISFSMCVNIFPNAYKNTLKCISTVFTGTYSSAYQECRKCQPFMSYTM